MENKQFTIDFFELLFLAEICIPPVPIARAMFFDNLSSVHYDKMNDRQRKQMFEVITKKEYFDIKNEDCLHFYNRFNPENQYNVLTTKKIGFKAYLHNDKYHVEKNKFIQSEFIVSVSKC